MKNKVVLILLMTVARILGEQVIYLAILFIIKHEKLIISTDKYLLPWLSVLKEKKELSLSNVN